jgi:hypothetical protein
MSKYKLIQLTNINIPALATDAFIPVGTITRRITPDKEAVNTFQVVSSNADAITLNEVGYYKVTYNASLSAAAAGELSVALIANGTSVYTSSGIAPTGTDDVVNITLPFVIRVCPNCSGSPTNCPTTIQLKLTAGTTVAGSTANLIIEKIY